MSDAQTRELHRRVAAGDVSARADLHRKMMREDAPGPLLCDTCEGTKETRHMVGRFGPCPTCNAEGYYPLRTALMLAAFCGDLGAREIVPELVGIPGDGQDYAFFDSAPLKRWAEGLCWRFGRFVAIRATYFAAEEALYREVCDRPRGLSDGLAAHVIQSASHYLSNPHDRAFVERECSIPPSSGLPLWAWGLSRSIMHGHASVPGSYTVRAIQAAGETAGDGPVWNAIRRGMTGFVRERIP